MTVLSGVTDDLIIIEDTPSLIATTPTHRPRGVPIDIARGQLTEALDEFMADAIGFNKGEAPRTILNITEPLPPHKAIKITTGAGKSVKARQAMARYIPTSKAAGLPHRVLYLVPTHNLGDEARLDMPAGITTALWQGRGAMKIGTDEPMCLNPDAVKAALAIGASVDTTACQKTRRGKEPILCPHHATCAYQAQKAAARDADVVFAAHETAFNLPKAIGDGFGLVFIDEAFWQSGIMDSRIAIGGLAHEMQAFPVRDHLGQVDVEGTDHLKDLIDRLQRALEASPDGYVRADILTVHGLTKGNDYEPGSCDTARKLEWKRKVDAGLSPDSSPERLREVRKQFGFMGQIPRRAAMWAELHELIVGADSGRLVIESETTSEGTVRWLRVLGRKDIDEKILDLPLIHADATMEVSLPRRYLPYLKMAIDVEAYAPHMKITQVVGLPVGKASLEKKQAGVRRGWKSETGEQAEDRVARKGQRLVDVVKHVVGKRRGLVVTYKAIADEFRQIDGIEVGHFNAIGGIDRWGNVEGLVVIGRPLPRPEDIERMAAALFGRAVGSGLPGRAASSPVKVERHIELADGSSHAIEVLAYEDPDAEMVRKAVTEAEIIQAVGRVRGVNRTAANPVEVYIVLGDTVVDLAVDAVVDFDSIEPDRFDMMLARGIVPQMPRDASRLYPDLFGTWTAARQAYHRRQDWTSWVSEPVTFPNRDISIRRCHWFRVRYRTKGRGSVPRLALIDPALIPDPRAALEAALGQIDLFEMLDGDGDDDKPEAVAEHLAFVPGAGSFQQGVILDISASRMSGSVRWPGFFFGHEEQARMSGLDCWRLH